jgi:hypothetical protein
VENTTNWHERSVGVLEYWSVGASKRGSVSHAEDVKDAWDVWAQNVN